MAEQLVATVRTAIAPADLYAVLRGAWRSLIGTEPSRSQLLVLLAQWAFETGNGAAANNYNLGGIKHVPGDGHDYARYQTREFVHGQWETLDQDFRAYPSLEAAAADYLQLLHTRFGFAWPAVENGDVQDFAHRLKLRGYYTAPEQQYSKGLVVRRQWLEQQLGPDTQPELATSADDVLEAARGEALQGAVTGVLEERPDNPEPGARAAEQPAAGPPSKKKRG